MSGLFGGAKRDKALEAMQARQRNEANQDRAAMEQDKARVTGAGKAGRKGRAQLRSKRASGLKVALGA